MPDWNDNWSDDDRMRVTKLEHRTRWLRSEVLGLWFVVVVLVLAVLLGTFR